MKKRTPDPAPTVPTRKNAAADETALCKALLQLEDVATMRAFLRDLCTPAELEALTDRWKVVPYILDGVPYRRIHELTGVSVTTVGRVARFLNGGNGGYLAAVARLEAAPKRARKGTRS